MAMSKQQQGDPAGFLDLVGPDLSACVFARLADPADLARAATVSRPWRRFVEGNGFLKKVCIRKFPELAVLTGAVEVRRSPAPSPEPSGGAEAREHRIYSHLYGALVAAGPDARPAVDCILHCIGASSTDNFPDETIDNTLEPQDRINNRFSYWSSAGQDDSDVPETLTYRLGSDICVIDEIRIQPFKAFFQIGHPIYSSKMVRFRMGHCKLPRRSESFLTDDDDNQAVIADENYIWTYTSPEFLMFQENKLQTFKLPRPVLCIGGVVKIELLGRVQKQATDDRYYICVCHAQVVGRSLSPVFMVNINDSAGYAILKCGLLSAFPSPSSPPSIARAVPSPAPPCAMVLIFVPVGPRPVYDSDMEVCEPEITPDPLVEKLNLVEKENDYLKEKLKRIEEEKMKLELYAADVVDDHKIKMDAMRLKIRKYAINKEAWYHYAVGSIITLVAILIAFVVAFKCFR